MLGTALRKAMSERNVQCIQLLRRTPTSADQLQWDPKCVQAISSPERLEGLTAAIHLSGANIAGHRWTDAYKREIMESRVLSTSALAKALAGLKRPPQMLLVASAVGFYGDRGDELLDETSRPGSGFLAEACQQWEAAAQPARDAGIRVIHLRFGAILGPDDGALGKLLPIFKLGLGGKLGTGRQYMSWISLPDAVAGIFYLLDEPAAAGPFNFTAPNPVTNSQFTHTLSAQLHRPAFFRVPAFALRLALGQMADEALLASVRAYPARLVNAGFQFNYPSLVYALPAILPPRHR
jgi:hypothetical protein